MVIILNTDKHSWIKTACPLPDEFLHRLTKQREQTCKVIADMLDSRAFRKPDGIHHQWSDKHTFMAFGEKCNVTSGVTDHGRLFNDNKVAMQSSKNYCKYCLSDMVRSKRYPQRLITGAGDVQSESDEDSREMEEAFEEEEEERRKRR